MRLLFSTGQPLEDLGRLSCQVTRDVKDFSEKAHRLGYSLGDEGYLPKSARLRNRVATDWGEKLSSADSPISRAVIAKFQESLNL
jgi:hypothetical protein